MVNTTGVTVGAYGVGLNLEVGFSAKTAVRSDKIRRCGTT